MYQLQPNISLCLADIDFHLQGVVIEASDLCIPPLSTLQRLLKKEMWEHQHHPVKTNLTLIQGSRTLIDSKVLFSVGHHGCCNQLRLINQPLMHLQRNHDSYQTPCTLIKEG